MRDGPPTCQGVKMVAAAPAAQEIEVVVVVANQDPAEGRATPPFLVPEASLVGEARLTLEARGDQVDHELAHGPARADVSELNPAQAIHPREEVVAAPVPGTG